jgi:DNA-binding IclR family transcriptional regulator
MTALERAFARWQAATSEHERTRLALLAAIRKAADRGMSQAEIAKVLGWPRQRVHEALK